MVDPCVGPIPLLIVTPLTVTATSPLLAVLIGGREERIVAGLRHRWRARRADALLANAALRVFALQVVVAVLVGFGFLSFLLFALGLDLVVGEEAASEDEGCHVMIFGGVGWKYERD